MISTPENEAKRERLLKLAAALRPAKFRAAINEACANPVLDVFTVGGAYLMSVNCYGDRFAWPGLDRSVHTAGDSAGVIRALRAGATVNRKKGTHER